VPPPLTTPGFESLSAATEGGGAGRAYELKFLLDEGRARQVEAWARRRLAIDPHGDPDLDGARRTVSLYCDTPELDVYYRSPRYKKHKFRARRQGPEPWAVLERQSKRGDRVETRCVCVPLEEVARLAHPESPGDWAGHWFHACLLDRWLEPACRVEYLRTTYAGTGAEGPLRLTLDRHVCGVLADGWDLDPVEGGLPLLPGRVLLEFRFHSALPAAAKDMMREFGLSPSPASKYRLCREACDVAAASREFAVA
jgi:hypothetical protein